MDQVKKFMSLLMVLVLCMGLSVPALAEEAAAKIAVGDQTYERILQALMAQTEDEPVTLRLESDIVLTGAAVVLGTSDYGGMFGGAEITVIPHDVTIDLNGHTLTGEEGLALFEVQEGYKLTIIDSSAEKTGQIVTRGDTDVIVKDGAVYNPMQKIAVGDQIYERLLQALLAQTEDEPVTLRLESDIWLTGAAVVLGASDYGGMFGGAEITVIPHDVTIDLNGHTLTGEEGLALFEVQEGYTLTIIDSSAEKSGQIVTRGETITDVTDGGVYLPLMSAYSIAVHAARGTESADVMAALAAGETVHVTAAAPAEAAGMLVAAVYGTGNRLLDTAVGSVAFEEGVERLELTLAPHAEAAVLKVLLLEEDSWAPCMAAAVVE